MSAWDRAFRIGRHILHQLCHSENLKGLYLGPPPETLRKIPRRKVPEDVQHRFFLSAPTLDNAVSLEWISELVG